MKPCLNFRPAYDGARSQLQGLDAFDELWPDVGDENRDVALPVVRHRHLSRLLTDERFVVLAHAITDLDVPDQGAEHEALALAGLDDLGDDGA